MRNMQINRLFEIVYLLMERESVTAGELAERFEVSVRTVYRDIDTLSGAGIPVYAGRGRNGGIRLMERFTLSKSLLSEKEQSDILASLQGFSATRAPDVEPVLRKLAALFGNKNTSWLDVDFSRWGSGEEERKMFPLLKTAILGRRVITFQYFSSYGQKTERAVEPLKLLFKGQNWYLYGFCRQKQACRVFKITRMKKLSITDETFDRAIPETPIEGVDQPYKGKMVPLRLRLDASQAFRVYDEFTDDQIEKNEDGSFTATTAFPEGEWIYGYILSFGAAAQVLEPEDVRRETVKRLRETLKQYESEKKGGKLNG